MCSKKMNSLNYNKKNQKLHYESFHNKEDNPCRKIQNISIIIHKKNQPTTKGRKKYRYNSNARTQPTIIYNLSHFQRKNIKQHYSMPDIINAYKLKQTAKNSNATSHKIANSCGAKHAAASHSFKYKYAEINRFQPNYTIYRCQVGTNVAENCNNCCCSCNSDTMFEVMKDLYECYKNRNCENCNCILCCNLPADERFKEQGKPYLEINLESALKELAMKGFALPEGKTVSEKELIDTIRKVLGLPPEPMSQEMRDKYIKAANAGLMLPLEGKSTKQKEKILRDLHAMDIPLPVGRTLSEESLIRKILGKASQHFQTLNDNIQDAKRSGLLLITYEGKSPDQIEKILNEVAMRGIPLPEPQTPLLKNLIQKVRADLGLPPEPKNLAMRAKHKEAAAAGLLLPLEGKTPEEKELILQALDNMKIPLPEGRTPSEKVLIAKVRERRKLEEKTASHMIEGEGPVDECICELLAPRHLALSEKNRRAKAAGLLTPIKGKSKVQKEKILKGLALEGLPLPKGDTASETRLIKKVRIDLGLPPEPKSSSMRDTYTKAAEDGILLPLEGKLSKEKEKILKALHSRGIPLPKGRTASEKILIDKILKEPREQRARKSVTFLKGKTPKEQEKIIRDLAMKGKPLPEANTESAKNLLNKVRVELGLPPEPRSLSMRNKYDKAAEMGLLQPLEGKTIKEKENILRELANIGMPLPKSRTPSEKALIAKIKGEPRQHKIKVTPGIEGETLEEKENKLREMALKGVAFPIGKTPSETKLLIKVRNDLGLPPEPKSSSVRDKYTIAAENGLLIPLEGHSFEEKEKILRGLMEAGIPLPRGRSSSEKSLIIKIQYENMTPEKIRKAKVGGLFSSLELKTPSQREHILRGRAMMGMTLPKGETASQNKLIVKIRRDLGLPPEPKQSSMRHRYARAADIGALQPLEGKTPKQKEKIVRKLIDLKLPLPKGRTPSEQAMIDRVQKEISDRPKLTSTERMRRAKAAGLLTPLKGKTPAQKEKILKGLARHGIPLPEGKTKSENDILYKLRLELGLPPEPNTSSIRARYVKATEAGILQPLEGKTSKEKEKILRGLADAGIPLPKGRTPSEKALIRKVKGEPHRFPKVTPSEKMRKAKAAGLLTPLKGKSPAQKEKILKGLAKHGIPLPEGKTESEKDILYKLRLELGLPPEPTSSSIRDRYAKATEAGTLQPLEGKTPKEKEKILRGLADAGIPLPKARTPSEKALIKKIKGEPRSFPKLSPSDKMRRARDAGLLTPFSGKSPSEIEKILQGRAYLGISLPEGKTTSEKNIINKVRLDLGLPPEPTTSRMREKHEKAAAAGILQPLEGKSYKEKKKILQGLADMDILLPEGRTASEKILIDKVRDRNNFDLMSTGVPEPSITTEKLKQAKAAGLLTPLENKSLKEKERILKHLAKIGLPLPEGKTRSEKALINKIVKDYGLGKQPSVEKLRKAKASGFLTPLDGKTPPQKEKILRGRAAAGLPLPKGKSTSEKELINKIKTSKGYVTPSPSELLKKSEAAGLLSPLDGKTPSEKEKYLRRIAAAGIPLPAGKTPSEKQLIKKLNEIKISKSDKIRATKSTGHLPILKGKSPDQKEKILKELVKKGTLLPEGTTPSEKALLDKIRNEMGLPPAPKTLNAKVQYKKAHDAGIITPLEGKTLPEKENILRKLHEAGIPLPIGRTPSEKHLMKKVKTGVSEPFEDLSTEKKEKILRGLLKSGKTLPEAKTSSTKALIKRLRKDMGLPPEPRTPSMKEKMREAHSAGLITPLEGKTPAQKEKILRRLAEAGIPLPEAKTTSEKAIKRKVVSEFGEKFEKPSKEFKKLRGPIEETDSRIQKAKKAGLQTPLNSKSLEEKEKIVRGLAKLGLPLPEGTTKSDKQLITNIRKDMGLPQTPETSSMRKRHDKAAAVGALVPLEGLTTSEKEKVLRSQAKIGLQLPEGRTSSENSLIAKIKEEKALSKVSPVKLQKAKDAGLLTPLKGKSQAEKEKIIKGRAEAGLPLPEGQTVSEKSLIKKIAKETGLLMPLTGKTDVEKEKILQGLIDAGLPLPEGKTSTERALIKRIKEEYSKSMKESKIDVLESKITKCERACGCDKKKIKFKHSYVKIRVTSPDISSLCPCPNDCVPRVKGGVFVDNDGINVIVERTGDIPLYIARKENTSCDQKFSLSLPTYFKSEYNNCNDLLKSIYDAHSLKSFLSDSESSKTDFPLTSYSSIIESIKYNHERINTSFNNMCLIGDYTDDLKSQIFDVFSYVSNTSTVMTITSQDSFDSIIILKSETSLSFSNSYEDINTNSDSSFAASTSTSNTYPYIIPVSNYDLNNSILVKPEFLSNGDKHCTIDTDISSEVIIQSTLIASTDKNKPVNSNLMPEDVSQVSPMSSTKLIVEGESKCNIECEESVKEPVIIITNLNSDFDVKALVDDLISKKEFSEASSLFIVVPSDEEENEICCAGLGCTQYIKISENGSKWQYGHEEPCWSCCRKPSKLEDMKVTKRHNCVIEDLPTAVESSIDQQGNNYNNVKHDPNWLTRNKICQITTPSTLIQGFQVVSTDTTQDRPCCCGTRDSAACAANVMSNVITPDSINLGIKSNKSITRTNNIQQASAVSIMQSPSTASVGQISESLRSPNYQSEYIVQYPYNNSENEPRKDFKKLLHKNLSPQSMNKILIEMEQSNRKGNASPTDFYPEETLLGSTPINENYLICHQHKYKKHKNPKWVSGDKALRIDDVCDCIHPQPSFIKTKDELELANQTLAKQNCAVTPHRTKPFNQVISRFHRTPRPPVFRTGALVSIGVQDSPGCILCLSGLPCTSEHKKCIHLSNTNIQKNPAYSHANHQSNLSPLRSYAAIGSGGIYTQRDFKRIRYNTDTGVGVDLKNTGTEKYTYEYSNKQVQKNSNVCFELPTPELESKPRPIPQYMLKDNERREKKVILMKPNITQTASIMSYDDLMKPNITQTASRVTYDDKPFLKPRVKPSCTIEDIIRYYAIFKPDVLNTLISLTSIKKSDVKYKSERYDEPAESSGVRHLTESRGFTKEPREQDSRHFTGFTIRKAGTSFVNLATPKKDITLQASFLTSPTVSRCEILPCDTRQVCHSPQDLLIFPFGTPLSEPLLKLKKLLEENCSPDKVKHIFQLIEAGNLKDIDWDEAMRISSDPLPEDSGRPKLDCRFPFCEGHPGCHSAEEVLQYPFGTPLSPSVMKLKKLVEQNDDKEKVKDFLAHLEAGNEDNASCKKPIQKPNILQSKDCQSTFSKSSANCRVLPGESNPGRHSPDKVFQYPFSTSLPPQLLEIKNLIEHENKQEKVKPFFKQLSTNKKNNNCETYINKRTNLQSKANPLEFSKAPLQISQCQPDHEVHDEQSQDYYLQHLLGSHLSPYLADLETLVEQNDGSKKVKHLMEQTKTENCTNCETMKEIPVTISLDNCSISSPKTSTCIVSSCHSPEEVFGYPYGTPLPLHLKSLKNILEQNHNPQKVRDLLRQIEAGDLRNLDWAGTITRPTRQDDRTNALRTKPEPRTSVCQDSSITKCHMPKKVIDNGARLPQFLLQLKKLFKPNICDWVQAIKSPDEFLPKKYIESKRTISTCRVPPCQGHPGCHVPDQLQQYPFGTPLPQQLEEFKKLLEQNFNPIKVKQLFAEIEAGNIEHLDLDTAMTILADDEPGDCTSTDSFTSSGPCQIPPYGRAQNLEHPLPQHLIELKDLLEQCCSPETVRHLLKQIEAGNLKDLKSTGCGEEFHIVTPDICPPSVSTATESPDYAGFPPGALPPVVVVLPPEVYAPAPKDQDCAVCRKPKYRNGMKMQCACKKKSVKIKQPCPCEVHKVPISTEEPGLKISTRSVGGQCCICDEYSTPVKKSGQDVVFKLGQSAPSIIGTPDGPVSTGIQDGTGCLICPTGMPCSSEHSTCPKLTITTIKPFPLGFFGQPDINAQKGELEIIGPRGGYVVVGPDGIYTQAGIKQIRFSTAAATDPEFNNVDSEPVSKNKKNCLCFGSSKKKRKIVCQCPSESDDQEPLLLYTYDDFEEARKASKIFKSNLTQTTSGFRVKKPKQPKPPPEPDYLETAIRQYAVIKPELFRELCSPGISITNRKGRKKDCACEEDKSVDTYEIMKRDRKGNFVLEKEEPVPEPLEELPTGGFKFSIGGKGSGSKGLSGICCFEMYQDS